MIMRKISVKPFRPVYPSPAALITSVASDGKANIITLGEVYNLSVSKPVIVGISIAKARYSHKLISESLEYVVNLPTTRILEKVDRCGTMSGRDVDKFAELGLTPIPASKVKPPLIAECPINLECEVIKIEEIGDHDMFVGEVIVEHVDEELLDERGRLQVEKLDGLCYVLSEYWSLGQKLGYHGFSRHIK
ncbi:flavin reductase family protein [Candidatus Poribacteria bacterium]|nr:flavin reductase family protein [Candidatus Poribacteria bacterium]